MTADGRVATIHGIALRPGVSKNGRRYTKENIGNAHKRLSQRLADPNGRPVVMRTYHPGNGSDHQAVTNIVGRLTGASLDENGALHFYADIPDTAAGQDVASLVTASAPFLRNVSIRGWWVDDPIIDGQGCESAHDLEIDGLDFVTNPGVEGAQIVSAALSEMQGIRHPITESTQEVRINMPPPTHLSEADRDAIAAKIVEGLKGETKPLHEMSPAEVDRYANEAWRRAFPSLYRGAK